MRKTLSPRAAERRQRREHPEFRIAEPEWDAGERARLAPLLGALTDAGEAVRAAEAAQAALTANDAAKDAAAARHAGSGLSEKDLADAATQLWRAQRRLNRLAEEDSREARRVGRNLASMRDALAAAGVSIQDHDGDDYHEGQSLEVLAFEDDPALTREVVRETVRPSIYLGGSRVQMGQVIVGCPAVGAGNDEVEDLDA